MRPTNDPEARPPKPPGPPATSPGDMPPEPMADVIGATGLPIARFQIGIPWENAIAFGI